RSSGQGSASLSCDDEIVFKPMVDKPARERAVVAAALRLIAQEGDAAMTVRRVAAEAKIPMSSLYELFASQDAVWAAVMREVAGRISQRIEALPTEPSDRQWGR